MQLSRLSLALGEANVVGCDDQETERVVKSAGRVLRILELFDILKREVLVSEVSDLLSLPQSSTSVLLRSMVVLGYLYFNPEARAFGPTTRVAMLGNWINGPMISDGPLVRLLQRINVRTGQAVVLAARNRVWAEYIHVLQATSPVRLFVVKGSRRPLIRSGTGLALLADLPDSDIKRIALRFNAEARTAKPQLCISKLMDQVARVRTEGYAISYDMVTKGGGMIAMRLTQLVNGEHFAIGVAGVTTELRENEGKYIDILREEISLPLAEPETHELRQLAV